MQVFSAKLPISVRKDKFGNSSLLFANDLTNQTNQSQ